MSWLVVRPTYNNFDKARYYCNPVIRDRKPDDKLGSAYKYNKVVYSDLLIIDYGDYIEINSRAEERPLTEWDEKHSKEIKNPGKKKRQQIIFSLFWNGVI